LGLRHSGECQHHAQQPGWNQFSFGFHGSFRV